MPGEEEKGKGLLTSRRLTLWTKREKGLGGTDKIPPPQTSGTPSEKRTCQLAPLDGGKGLGQKRLGYETKEKPPGDVTRGPGTRRNKKIERGGQRSGRSSLRTEKPRGRDLVSSTAMDERVHVNRNLQARERVLLPVVVHFLLGWEERKKRGWGK